MNVESLKGRPCLYKPILCQEGWCEGCQIHLDYQGHQRAMGREKEWRKDIAKDTRRENNMDEQRRVK